MRIVIALGGNALLRRGEAPELETQRRNVRGMGAYITLQSLRGPQVKHA
jgi:carbamate kinase